MLSYPFQLIFGEKYDLSPSVGRGDFREKAIKKAGRAHFHVHRRIRRIQHPIPGKNSRLPDPCLLGMERATGLEPATPSLGSLCSAN